ncbi:MAG: hypothetical protein ACRC2J_18710 [Microcoleaceae cyanobacterium]
MDILNQLGNEIGKVANQIGNTVTDATSSAVTGGVNIPFGQYSLNINEIVYIVLFLLAVQSLIQFRNAAKHKNRSNMFLIGMSWGMVIAYVAQIIL